MVDASSSPALPWLWNARVQRVDGPTRDSLSLTFFDRGQKFSLLFVFGSAVRGMGARRDRPLGEAASAYVQRLRTQLGGARLHEAHWLGTALRPGRALAIQLSFARGEHRASIVVDFDDKAPNLFLLRDDGTIAGASDERARRQRFADKERAYEPGSGAGIAIIETTDALFERGSTLLETTARRVEDDARTRAKAKARAALKKLERKIEAIRGDLARAEAAPLLRREAHVLLANLSVVERGATQVKLLDPSVDPPEWLELTLDPTRSAQQLAQQRFERARKVERGVSIASARLRESEREAEALRDLLARLEAGEAMQALGELTDGSVQPEPTRGKARVQQRMPYRVFFARDGQKLLVGKGAADNDTLTLTVARPHDHWLHVRGVPGSHVVVPLERKVSIGQELLLDAATLAAHFSKQRGEPTVEIAHTERRFVRKPKGAPAGSVNVDRERVFVLRVEPARLARLLATERT